MSQRPKILFFDAVGTLIRPARPIGYTYAMVASHYGAALDPEGVQSAFRRVFEQMQHRPSATVPENGDDRAWWRELVAQVLAECSLPRTFPFEFYFEELYLLFGDPGQWRVFPEVPSVLEGLAKKYLLGVLSNWDDRLLPVLEGLDLRSYFRHVWVSARLGAAKPDPKFYQRVLERVGLAAREVLLVGDDPKGDVEVPACLGWSTFWVQRPDCDLWDLFGFLGEETSKAAAGA
jgi:putative hydrolase of the HAD superfamily